MHACRYSEEELKALQEQEQEGAAGLAAGAGAVQQPAVAAQPLDPAALKKQLLVKIPKDRAGVFAFPINWSALDSAPADVTAKITSAAAACRFDTSTAVLMGCIKSALHGCCCQLLPLNTMFLFLAGWVAKKVAELLGEEPSFCQFIKEQLAAQVSADTMLEALRDVLDEDAESFVLKLWQILIYECLKIEHSK